MKEKKTVSLQTKITALILCGIIAVSLILSVISMALISDASKESVARIMNLTCERESEEVTTLLEDVEHVTEAAASYAEKHLDGAYVLEDEALREAYFDEIRYYFDRAAAATTASKSYYFRPDPEIAGGTAGFLNIYDADKGAYEPSEVTDLLAYPEDDQLVEWFYLTRKMGMAVWIKPYTDIHTGPTIISFCVPVYVENTFVGIAGMDVEFEQMASLAESISVYDTGYAFLCDLHGSVYVHKDLAYGTDLSSDPGMEALVKNLRRDDSEGTLLEVESEGKSYRCAFTTLINGMKLVLMVPETEMLSETRRMVSTLLLAILLTAIFFITLTIYFSGRVTRPLDHLLMAAKRIRGGDMNVELTVRGNDEIGELTAIFQSMVDQLSHYIRDVRRNAYVDGLTGVLNSTAYDSSKKSLDDTIKLGDAGTFGIAVLDVNNLKFINDTYGHDCGNTYICKASKLVCDVFHNSPVYRYGGDEFVVILKNYDYEHSDELLENLSAEMRIRNAAAENEWEKAFIAAGIAKFDAEKDTSVEDVFKRADEMMYANKVEMKKQGRRPV